MNNTYSVRFRTRDHADCTCYVHERSEASAIDYVREHYASKIGPRSNLVVTLIIDKT